MAVSEMQPESVPATQAPAVVRAENVSRRYGQGDAAVDALKAVSLSFQPRSFTAIMGPSGSGKSTLMHLLAGLDKPTSGRVLIEDNDLSRMKDKDLTLLRRKKVGFVFQFFNLLPTLTAEENITLPLKIAGHEVDRKLFDQIVATMGLKDRLHHKPSELSGGQQQRTAIARALVTNPAVVFADEPTGNLDSTATTEVLQLLRKAVDELHHTIIMVTHEPSAAATADRVVFLADGEVARDEQAGGVDHILDVMKELA